MGRDEDSQFPSDVFVGREAELAELRASVDKALHGIGQLFLISGESGIGKTRLAHELSWHAHSYGARVIWGRCWEGSVTGILAVDPGGSHMSRGVRRRTP